MLAGAHHRLHNLNEKEKQYKNAFHLFQMIVGLEHGDVHHLPYSGGVMEQPYKTAMMWSLFKNEVAAKIAKNNKEQAQKMRRK